jgi:hypothetical protein
MEGGEEGGQGELLLQIKACLMGAVPTYRVKQIKRQGGGGGISYTEVEDSPRRMREHAQQKPTRCCYTVLYGCHAKIEEN